MSNALHARRRLSWRRPLGAFVTVLATLLAVGIAFATWTTTGPGFGYATAGAAASLSTAVVVPQAALYPGIAAGNAVMSVVNPNSYPVTVTDVVGTGPVVTSPSVPACDASTGVTFTNQHGLSLVVPANSTGAQFTLAGSVSMSDGSDNSCQGATFAIPVTLLGHS